jgi:hypothetical protein
MLTSTLSKEPPFIDIQDGITLAHVIVGTVRDPLVVLDSELRVIAASRALSRDAVVDIASGPRGTAVSITHATFK